MRILRRGSYALGVLAAAALVGGCNGSGGSQSSGVTPSSGARTYALNPSDTFIGVKWNGNVHPDLRKSWISPDVQRAPRLLFVSDTATDDVDIFTMPDMALKGTITGFNQPQGECSDKHGNIYVANTQETQVDEYSRIGTLLNTYPDKSGYPVGCAVNPLNGDLAVANVSSFSGLGHVLLFTSPSSRPTMLINPAQVSYFFLGYDIHGDLWVDGRDKQKNYIVSSCGGFVCRTIDLTGGKIYFPGAVQWDQKEYSWVLFDQRCGNTTAACSYWVSGTGVLGQATNYQNYSGGAVCDLIQGVVAAYGKRYTAGSDYEYTGCPNAGNSSVNRWQYPTGGAPTNYATEAVTQQPAGAAISTQNVTTPPE